jgi:transcriptional repressor NrdR
MRCPYCNASESRVVDTTTDPANGEIRRRRQCLACHERFSTVERVRLNLPLVVKDGVEGMPARREPFDREKLRRGINIACAKRPISQAAIDRLVETIEAQLQANQAGEVASRAIGEMVIGGLRELDEVAYIRYAIVFLGLDDLAAVRDEIDRLLAIRPGGGAPGSES